MIAVDPTSPYTGGAILGDRIRMQGHAGDAGMFIRSMATRGFLGGLARATAEVALLLDAAGKQHVLIETVGVGQDEVDIVRLADCVVVDYGAGPRRRHSEHESRPDGNRRHFRAEQIRSRRRRSPGPGTARHAVAGDAARRLASAGRAHDRVENKGIDVLAAKIAEFRTHFESSGERRRKHVEHWKQRLIELLESRLLQKRPGRQRRRSSA